MPVRHRLGSLAKFTEDGYSVRVISHVGAVEGEYLITPREVEQGMRTRFNLTYAPTGMYFETIAELVTLGVAQALLEEDFERRFGDD